MNRRLVSISAAFLVSVSGAAGAQTRYRVTDLGVPPGFIQSYAYGVNDAGVVVGDAYDVVNNRRHAFRWEAGSTTDLGTLPGGQFSWANAINDLGDVAGRSQTVDNGSFPYFGYLLDGGPMVPLVTLPLRNTQANDLNNMGVVVGTALFDSFLPSQPAMWIDPATPVNLGGLMPDGGGEAFAINDAGWVVGHSYTFDGLSFWTHAFVWDGVGMADLGTFGGPTGYSRANDINSENLVVGQAENRPLFWTRAFVYQGGTMVNLGTLNDLPNSEANAINDAGLIVGWSNSGDPFSHAVSWESGRIHDLNDRVLPTTHGWRLVEAEEISDTGYIVGYGYPPGEVQFHAFLLTPIVRRDIQRVRIPRRFP
jgi:probable HAF family extracellular repeat protein